jgi:hypothetical protein
MTDRRVNRGEDAVSTTAAYMAEQLCRGFRAHDDRERERSIEAFFEVDRCQFAHLDDEAARAAATAYVEALWAKDALEAECLGDDGDLDPEAAARADWTPIEDSFRDRATVVGMNSSYARDSTAAWRRHKTSEDYWTPFLRAQAAELRAAIGDPEYPHKPKEGLSGYGPEPVRYVLGVELHDMHTETHWRQAVAALTPYYAFVLDSHRERGLLGEITLPS